MRAFASDENAAEQAWTAGPASHQALPSFMLRSLDPGNNNLSLPPKDFEDFVNNILRDEDDQKYPRGLSRLAAHYVQFENADILPRFRYSTMRVILDRAQRCAFLERKLIELDRSHAAHATDFSEAQKRPPGQATMPDEYTNLLNELEQARLSYQQIVRCYLEMQQLHPVPDNQYRNTVEMAIGENMLEREGYMVFDNDMVWGSRPSNAAPIANFFRSRYGQRFLNMLNSDLHSWLLHDKTAEWILKCVLVLIGSTLVLVPGGLLYLGYLTDSQSFGVITSFTILFAIVTVLFQDWEMYKTLVAVLTYCAVLFTIGAQSSGINPQSI